MKTWLMVGVAMAVGVAAGYGSLLGEFAGAPEQFEPNSQPVAKVHERGSTQTEIVDTTHMARVLVLNGETYNFGIGQRSTELSHAFEFKNVGNGPLELNVGHTTCKCTVGKLDQEKVPPGATTAVTLTWKLTALEEEFSQGAEIYTNDPLRPVIKLLVEGLVIDKVRASPPVVALGEISAREGGAGRFFLFGYHVEQLAVVRSELLEKDSAEYFDVKFEEFDLAKLKDERNVTCALLGTVTVKSGLPLGPLNQTIRIATNVSDVQPLEVKLSGTVVSDISLVGAQVLDANRHLVDIGTISAADGASTLVHVLVKGPHRHDVKLSIGGIDPPDDLTATIGEPRKLRDGAVYMYPLTIAVPKNARPVNRLGSKQGELGKITIHTTHPTATTLPIYVRFAVK